jgi:hypothetical protein
VTVSPPDPAAQQNVMRSSFSSAGRLIGCAVASSGTGSLISNGGVGQCTYDIFELDQASFSPTLEGVTSMVFPPRRCRPL